MAREDETSRGDKIEDGLVTGKVEHVDLYDTQQITRRILLKMDTRSVASQLFTLPPFSHCPTSLVHWQPC